MVSIVLPFASLVTFPHIGNFTVNIKADFTCPKTGLILFSARASPINLQADWNYLYKSVVCWMPTNQSYQIFYTCKNKKINQSPQNNFILYTHPFNLYTLPILFWSFFKSLFISLSEYFNFHWKQSIIYLFHPPIHNKKHLSKF